MLCTSNRYVRDLIKKKELEAIKIGRGYKISETALLKFIEKRKTV